MVADEHAAIARLVSKEVVVPLKKLVSAAPADFLTRGIWPTTNVRPIAAR
jgi:hypothetical protein